MLGTVNQLVHAAEAGIKSEDGTGFFQVEAGLTMEGDLTHYAEEAQINLKCTQIL